MDHLVTTEERFCTAAEMERYERVFGELVACYGEGEDTDWPYLTDLASLIVDMIEREIAR